MISLGREQHRLSGQVSTGAGRGMCADSPGPPSPNHPLTRLSAHLQHLPRAQAVTQQVLVDCFAALRRHSRHSMLILQRLWKP